MSGDTKKNKVRWKVETIFVFLATLSIFIYCGYGLYKGIEINPYYTSSQWNSWSGSYSYPKPPEHLVNSRKQIKTNKIIINSLGLTFATIIGGTIVYLNREKE